MKVRPMRERPQWPFAEPLSPTSGASQNCRGAALVRLEGRIALTHLLDEFTDIRLADGTPWDPRQHFTRTVTRGCESG